MEEVTVDAKQFAVKTHVFEGPLELLLELVEKRKLLINDISLAEVTDEYMAEVSRMQERSMPGTANFIALAATLLLIKSKSLLPVFEVTSEEEDAIEDLEERLKLYAIYRDAGKILSEQFGKNAMHGRLFVGSKNPLFVTDAYTTNNALKEAMYRVIQELPISEVKPKVKVRKVISLEEMVDRLHQRIEKHVQLKFSDLLEDTQERTTVIVGFLAVLESVKQGSILVAQAERFHDIHIEKEGFQAPSYL